jgi:hypothetical protein
LVFTILNVAKKKRRAMFWMRQIPQGLLPFVLIAIGVFMILCGTVLYWPSERLGDRMDQQEKYRRD